jgi:hypothetical protein
MRAWLRAQWHWLRRIRGLLIRVVKHRGKTAVPGAETGARTQLPSAGHLLVQAFVVAKLKQQSLHEIWVRISHRVGSRLPSSLLSVAIQRDGELDLVLRTLEDEQAARMPTNAESGMFEFHYLNMLSVYWIGGMYETFALLRRRKLADASPLFQEVLDDLEIARITLEKHEIAKDRVLQKPLPLLRAPANNDPTDFYSYDPKDDLRAHIMPSGVSMRGSIMWSVLDVKKDMMRWIERRALSDKILALWNNSA